jgi:hypothetical protein
LLLFAQGGLCFFCQKPLAKEEASVEHLFAVANGGPNIRANCVVCCKAFNGLLGSMTLKEKFRVVLNQKGTFRCPVELADRSSIPAADIIPAPVQIPPPVAADKFEEILENLKRRGNSKPRTLTTLVGTLTTLLLKDAGGLTPKGVVERMEASGKITIDGYKVAYHF